MFATSNPRKRTVLITGCSDGGLGAALAVAFHKAGLRVYATARNADRMKSLAVLGIEVLTLDVQSEASIADCVEKVPHLDILVNNAGQLYTMPLADVDIAKAKNLFDVNVWSSLAMTQAFLPLLLKSSNGVVVNHTSAASVVPVPFSAIYSSSKVALAMMTDCLRLELQPFNIKVVDLRSGLVKSNMISTLNAQHNPALPDGSIYAPAKEVVEKAMRQEQVGQPTPADQWAAQVVGDVLKASPPPHIWRGKSACPARFSTLLPSGTLDGTLRKMTGLDVVEKTLRK
ncbi:NAD(P)-binding protein [Hypoxylon sp. NC1633]|nr:NAD(P)-binding protein [Hypoxylon sp. NC1633]